jgi:hypothetical protein
VEEVHLAAELAVVALLGFLEAMQMASRCFSLAQAVP